MELIHGAIDVVGSVSLVSVAVVIAVALASTVLDRCGKGWDI